MGEMRDTGDFSSVVEYILTFDDWRPGNGLTILAKSPPYPMPPGTDTMSRHRRVMAMERVGYVTPVPAELVINYSGVERISCEQGGLKLNCADGYYNFPERQLLAKGVKANMESARPVMREPDEAAGSAMRVALTSAPMGSGSPDKGFVEIGWGYAPGTYHGDNRYVYVSYECANPDPNYSCLHMEILFDLPDDDYEAHEYRLNWHEYYPFAEEQWAFYFDGELVYPTFPWELKIDFDQGMSVSCGGETTVPHHPRYRNDIGPAACLDVSYTQTIDGGWWYPLSAYSFRVDSGNPNYYDVTVINRNSWQSHGPLILLPE